MKRKLVLLIIFLECFKIIFFRWHGYSLAWYLIPIIAGSGIGLMVCNMIDSRNVVSFARKYAMTLFAIVWTVFEIGMSRACIFLRGSEDVTAFESCYRLGQLSRTFLVAVILTLILKVPTESLEITREGSQIGKGLSFKFSRDWSVLYFVLLFIYIIYMIITLK